MFAALCLFPNNYPLPPSTLLTDKNRLGFLNEVRLVLALTSSLTLSGISI